LQQVAFCGAGTLEKATTFPCLQIKLVTGASCCVILAFLKLLIYPNPL
jgi:hypothetical protein